MSRLRLLRNGRRGEDFSPATVVRLDHTTCLDVLEAAAAGALIGFVATLASIWSLGDEWLFAGGLLTILAGVEIAFPLAAVPLGAVLAVAARWARLRRSAQRICITPAFVELVDGAVRTRIARADVRSVEDRRHSVRLIGGSTSITVGPVSAKCLRAFRGALTKSGYPSAGTRLDT